MAAQTPAETVTSTERELEYEARAAAGAIWTGGRLFIGIVSMAYASLAFAYFYLRSSNNENLWRPHGITAPTALGASIFAVVLAGAALNAFGVRRLRAGQTSDWLVAGWLTVIAGLLAIALQVFELTRLPFFPGSSGYASCFIGWSGLNIASLAIGTYWIETVLARGMRLRVALGHDPESVEAASTRQFRADLESCTLFWEYLGVIALLFWILFYVV